MTAAPCTESESCKKEQISLWPVVLVGRCIIVRGRYGGCQNCVFGGRKYMLKACSYDVPAARSQKFFTVS